MNEKDLIQWARKKSQDEEELSIADARAQLSEQEELARQATFAKMKELGTMDPQKAAEALWTEEDEKARANEAQRIAAEALAMANDAEKDADDLDAINEWRLEDDMPTIDDLGDAAVDELEAAYAGKPTLLIRRKRQTALR